MKDEKKKSEYINNYRLPWFLSLWLILFDRIKLIHWKMLKYVIMQLFEQ